MSVRPKESSTSKCYLVEESLWELLEALGAHEALLVVELPVAVHYLLSRGKTTFAALAHGVGQSVGHVAGGGKTTKIPQSEYAHIVKTRVDIERQYLW